jgi:hypothetical protein
VPSVASAASKGEACKGLLDHVQRKVQESAERRMVEKSTRKECANLMQEDEDYLLSTEMDDPGMYKQAMATRHALYSCKMLCSTGNDCVFLIKRLSGV